MRWFDRTKGRLRERLRTARGRVPAHDHVARVRLRGGRGGHCGCGARGAGTAWADGLRGAKLGLREPAARSPAGAAPPSGSLPAAAGRPFPTTWTCWRRPRRSGSSCRARSTDRGVGPRRPPDRRRAGAGVRSRMTGRSAAFAPVVDAGVRVLVLGSLPGAESLRQRQYYAHPRNAFWRLIGAVAGRDLAALPYPARLAALVEARIGLWDVIATAERPGSLDAAIRAPEHADFLRSSRACPSSGRSGQRPDGGEGRPPAARSGGGRARAPPPAVVEPGPRRHEASPRSGRAGRRSRAIRRIDRADGCATLRHMDRRSFLVALVAAPLARPAFGG